MNDHKLLVLLSSVITGNSIDQSIFCDTSYRDWKELFELSCPHGVAAVCYDAISTLPAALQPPKMISISWLLEVEKAEKSYAKKCAVIEKLSHMLASHDIEFVLMKGAATASYYPTPEHRYFGDIDFYVLDSSGHIASDEADKLISESFHLSPNSSYHHHNTFRLDGVLLENHYDFIESHSHRSSALFELELKKHAVEPLGTTVISTSDACAHTPSATFNALFLMKHMAHHFAAGEIGLRHILDYGLFLKAEYQNIDIPTVLSLFEQYHLTLFASTVNSILTSYLSLPQGISLGLYAHIELTQKVLTEIVHPSFPVYRKEDYNHAPISSLIIRTHRFFSYRWKHDLIYPENFWTTFFRSSFTHLLKPKTLLK